MVLFKDFSDQLCGRYMLKDGYLLYSSKDEAVKNYRGKADVRNWRVT